MLALLFDGQQMHLVPDYPAPLPGTSEALIQVLLAGICSTDLEILRGYAGFCGIPGHEFVGRVVACDSQPALVGRRVVGEINAGCGLCPRCRAGQARHCPQRTVLGIQSRDGAFADLLTLPAANLHPVPDGVADEAAVFVEPLAAALQVRQQVNIRPGDRVVVLGVGRLGQLVARSLAGTGCELLAVGRSERKLALLEAAGIATALAGQQAPASADVVVDCTGQAAGFADALNLLHPEGTLVLKSTYHGLASLDLSRVVVDEINLVGSRCGPFEPALRLLASGAVDPRPLIDATYDLAHGMAALQHAARRGTLKVLLRASA